MGLGRLLTRQARPDVDGVRSLTDGWPLTLSSGSTWWPGTMYQGAMSIPGAWRAVTLLSGLLGSVPWDAYRKRAGQSVELLDTPPLLDQPAPPDTRMTTFSSLAMDLIWHGNAIAPVAARNRDGYPTAVYPVPADQVGVRRVTEASSPLPIGSVVYNVGGREFSSDDVIHIKGPCEPGALRGFGVLEAHLNGTIALAMEQAKQAGTLTRHGVPTGLLKVTDPAMTKEEAAVHKAGWLAAQAERSIAVLNPAIDFQPLAWNPEQLQLVDARRFSLTDMENIFGLPVGWLGGHQSSRQYSNIEGDAVNLVKFSLGDHLARFEQSLSLAFPRGTWVKANLDSILRADTLTRYQAHSLALDKGFLTVNEVREIEDVPPVPWGDEPPKPPVPVDNTPTEGVEDE